MALRIPLAAREHNVDAIAGADSSLPNGVGAKILLGARPDNDVDETITLTNITGSTAFPLTGNVDVWLSRVVHSGIVASDGWESAAAPAWKDLPVSSGKLTLGAFTIPADGLALLQITPAGSAKPSLPQ